MMATRSEKLKAIAQKAKQAQQPKEVKLDASDVAKVLDKQISDFKALFDSGVELKAAELIEELGKIKAFVPVIERFTDALSEIKVPDTIDVNIPESVELEGLHELKDVISTQSTILKSLNIPESIELQGVDDLKTVFEQQSKLLASVTIPSTVELDGLPQLVKLIDKYVTQISKLEAALGKEKTVHVDFINDSGVKTITDALGELSKAVGSNTTIANQAPSEAIPVRRVRKIGERLIFDDDVWTGSNAGGASVQDSLIENGRVKVDIGQNIQVSVGPSVEISNDVGNPVPVSGTVSVTEPVTVDATNLDIRDLSSATDSVTTVPSGTQTVSGTVEITNDVGNPIPVSGTVSVTEPVTVDATDLDIRNLSSATDSVEAKQATHDNFNANANLQVNNTDVSAANPVPVDIQDASITADIVFSAIDANNSTTTPLGSSATFTGVATDVSGYSGVVIQVYADTASAASGLKFETSNDGTNWDHLHSYTLIAASGKHYEETLPGKYFRIVYVNGTSAQAEFRLQTKLLKTAPVPHVHSIETAITGDHPATINRSVVTAKKPDGTYSNIESNDLGQMYVAPEYEVVIDAFETASGWSAFDGDTTNLATTTNHINGTLALTFDKANTAANNTIAGIQKTLTAIDLAQHAKVGGTLAMQLYVSDTTNVSYAFIRLGTDSTNYNEWRLDVADIASADWTSSIDINISEPTYAGKAGNGWNPSSVTFLAVGIKFALETNTLSGIIFDNLVAFTTQHTVNQISTAVSTPNVNIRQVGGSNTATSTGNATNGTIRVVEANNSPLVTDIGDTADAVVAAGAAGSLSAKTRRLTTDLDALKTIVDAVTYTEGDVDSTIDGVPILWEDTSNTLRTVSAAKPLPITGSLSLAAANYATRIDEASATVTYIGSADPGSATSGALWQVKKIDSNNPTSITFADGDALFDNIWDDRASLTYS
jgi:hypothetical protein